MNNLIRSIRPAVRYHHDAYNHTFVYKSNDVWINTQTQKPCVDVLLTMTVPEFLVKSTLSVNIQDTRETDRLQRLLSLYGLRYSFFEEWYNRSTARIETVLIIVTI